LHLSRENFAHRFTQALRAVNVPLVSGHIERIKEWNALYVIPVGVADQNGPAAALVVTHQLACERAPTRSAVDYDQRSSGRANLNAGGVPSVASRIRPRRRDRPTSSPELDPHR